MKTLAEKSISRLRALVLEHERQNKQLDQVSLARELARIEEDVHEEVELRTAEILDLYNQKADAWWRGVNDQWKHLPQGARLIEFANPYRDPKKPRDWVQSGVVTMPEEIQPKGSDDD